MSKLLNWFAARKAVVLAQKNFHTIQLLGPENRYPELCLSVVRENGVAIHMLTADERTPEVCLAALQQNPRAVAYLNAEDFSQSGALELCQWADEHWEDLVKHLDEAKALQIAEAVSGALQANQTDRPRSTA